MAATVWIVRKASTSKSPVINGLTTMILNNDNLDNEATTLADAQSAAEAAGYDLPPNYFDTAAQWDAVGQIDADGDAILFGDRLEAIS